MTNLLLILGSSFVLSLILTPLARSLAHRFDLVDRPDGRRKMHSEPVAVAGGGAILLSIFIPLTAFLVVLNPVSEQVLQEGPVLLGLLVAAVVICIVGKIDDYRGLRGRHKLLGQVVAISIVMASGVSIEHVRLFSWDIQLGLLSIPFTLFLLLGAINSLNLIDGMDGMLSCVGLIISLGLAVMAAMGEHWVAASLAVALAGSLLGFLRYNYPPATIFLGDAGSMLIGLVIGVLAIRSSLKRPATIALAAPTCLLTIPIFDTLAAIIRRKLTGRSIFVTDRGHLHHRLLQRGLSNQRVLWSVAFFCALTVLGGLASLAFHNEFLALFALVVVVGLVVTRLFGYVELLLLLKRLTGAIKSFWPWTMQGRHYHHKLRLQGRLNWDDLWDKTTWQAFELNLQTVSLDVDAPAFQEAYHARWVRFEEEPPDSILWRVEIPLVAHGHTLGRLEATGPQESRSQLMEILSLAKQLEGYISSMITVAHPDRKQLALPVNGASPVFLDPVKTAQQAAV